VNCWLALSFFQREYNLGEEEEVQGTKDENETLATVRVLREELLNEEGEVLKDGTDRSAGDFGSSMEAED